MEKERKRLDNEIIRRFQEGDEEAFEIIYEYHKLHVYYMARQFFDNPHTDSNEIAKDIVQQTFLEVYKNIGKLQTTESFFVWMERIAYRQCLMKARSEKSRPLGNLDSSEVDFDRITDDKRELSEEVMNQILYQEVQKAIMTLPKHLRLIAYMRFYEELTLREISEITKRPEGTVATDVRRIKEKLANALLKRGFSKNYVFAIVTIPGLFAYYQYYVDMQSPNLNSASQIIKNETKAQTKSGRKGKVKTIGAALAAGAILLPSGAVVLPTALNNAKSAQITEILYEQELTNKNIQLEIKTTNDNYETIEVNGVETITIEKNGEYTVSLKKKNQVLDERKIVVSNIDKEIPKILSKEWLAGGVLFQVEDKGSGVDLKSVRLESDGKTIDNYQINEEKQEIFVYEKKDIPMILYIADNIGNELKVSIQFTK